MLARLSGIALALGAVLWTAPALADSSLGTSAQALIGDFAANGPAPGPAKAVNADLADAAAAPAPANPDQIYSHIYQAPLFGSLFAVTTSEPSVDESALRYYASLHNVARTNAEIRRLKALHPSWTVPTNIYSTAGAGNDEQPFWDLLAADRLQEVREAIALRVKSEPGWKPSRDLTVKIDRKEAIEKLVKVSDAGKWTDVLQIADSDPSILHCAYMDANWRVAEAFIKIDQVSRAFEIYHAIVATCSDHEERLATVRKAISRFSVEQTKSLIAMGAKSADGALEFESVKIDLTRARIAAVNAGKSKDDIEAPALADFFAEAARTHERADLGLAGWFEYGRAHYADADKWFKLGVPATPPGKDADDVKLAEGHALSLLKDGKIDEARRVAWDWRDASPLMRDTYIGAMINLLTRTDPPATFTDTAIGDFTTIVEADRRFDGAQALAWHHQNLKDWESSALWFKTALSWKGVDPTVTPGPDFADPDAFKAIEGYATALSNVGRIDEAIEIADVWRGANSGLHALFVSLTTNAINASEHASSISPELLGHFAETVAADRSAPGAQALGWLDYRSDDFASSIDWFGKAIAWSANGKGDLKVNQGLALALKASGRFAEAEEISWPWRDQSPDLRATYIASFIAQISRDDLRARVSAARLDRFIKLVRADKSAVGAQALGWYRISQGNCGYAPQWFKLALAWSADRENDAKNAEGLALSLSSVGQFNEAEDVAYSWRDRSSELRALYIKIGTEELTREIPVVPMSEDRIGRFAEVVLADHASLGAQAIAWRRYRQAGCGYGVDWFRLATLWVDDDKRDAKTDEGYSLSLRAVGRLTEAEALASHWAASTPMMKKLYIDVVVEELSRDNPPEPVDEARLADFVAMIGPLQSPLGAQALGWYRLERGETAEAVKWFKNAVDWWPAQRKDATQRLSAPVEDYKPILAKLALVHADYQRTPRAYPNSSSLIGKSTELYVNSPEGAAKTMEGYALALRSVGRVEDAERIAYAWRDRWPSLRALFLDIASSELSRLDGAPLSAERIQRYLAVIGEDRSAAGASAMAWRQFGLKDYPSAATWFKTALDWSPVAAGATPDPRLVEGYVFALRSAKRFDEALAYAGRWKDMSPRFNVLFLETTLLSLRDSGQTDKLSAQKYAEIEAAMTQARSPEGALSIGWISYEGKDYDRALTWFQNALDWSADKAGRAKALEGLALSMRALGRYEDLATFARQWRDSSPEVRAAYYGGMIEWLTRADPLADVKPETQADFEAVVQTDRNAEGAQAIGWSHALRKDWPQAETWFKTALDWSSIDPLTPQPDAKIGKSGAKLIEGYVQALRNNGRLADAENIALSWSAGADALHGLYMQIFTQELATPDAAQRIPPERIARFAKLTTADRSPVGAQNLGWFAYRNKDGGVAVGWFEKAMAWSPGGKGDAKTNEGYALSLRSVGRLVESEEFAWTWRDQSPELHAAYVAAVSDQLFKPELSAKVTPARLERFATVVRADKSAPGAQAMGWRRLQDGNCGYSVGWFRSAVDWSPDHKGDDKTQSGLAQSLRAVGMYNEAEDVAFAGRDQSKEMRELYINIGVEELTREWPRVEMSEFRLARFGVVALADRSSVAAQALAWRRYGEAGCGYGGQWFKLAASWSVDGKGDAKLNEGYALTQRAAGRLTKAEALAFPWIASQPFMKKLYIDIAVEELSRDNPPEPMPEARIAAFEATVASMQSALGAQAIGWYRYERGENVESAKWFQNALDWWPHPKTEGDPKLAAPVEDYKPILAALAMTPEAYRRTPRAYPNSSLLIGHDTESYVETTIGLANTVEGYVMALRQLGRWEQAEGLAFDWRDRSPRLRELFIETAIAEMSAGGAAIPQDRIDRFVAVVDADHSSLGAQALAWRSYAAQDFEAASHWFKSTLDWKIASKDAPPDANLIEAYALSLRGAKKYDEALQLLTAWRGKLPALQTLYIQIGLDDLQAGDPSSPAAVEKLAAFAAEISKAKSADGADSLGWLAYGRKEFPAAQAWFKQAIVWALPGALPDVKALEGYARSLQAQDRLNDFVTFTGEWSQRVPALKPIYLEAAAQMLGAAAASGDDIPTDELVRAGAAFAEAHSANGAQSLAWQRIAAKDWVAAEAWFKAALAWSNDGAADPKINEGLIIALRNLKQFDDAEAIAFAGAANDENMRELYIEIVSDRLTRTPPAPPNEKGMLRFADFVANAKSATGAQALGWYSYNVHQLPAAVAWFEKSIGWDPSENAALGLAFAYRQLGDKVAYAKVLETYRAQYAKIADLAGGRATRLEERRAVAETGVAEPSTVSTPRRARASGGGGGGGDGGSIAAALNAKDYSGCVERADAASRSGALNAAQQSALGWCLLNLKRPQESASAFDSALKATTGKAREDAAFGKSLALLASGQAVEAGTVAGQVNLAADRRNALGIEILARRAWDAYAQKRYGEAIQWLDRRVAYAPETTDLMRMRADCLQKLGRTDAAAAITQNLDAQLGQ